jgi:hypothetical protein
VNFIAGQHRGKPFRPPRANDAVDPWQRLTQHGPVEEEQGGKCLGLSGGRHVAIDRKVGQECLDLRTAHIGGMPLAVEQDVAPDPCNILLLCAVAVVPDPQRLSHPIEEPRFIEHAA